MSRAVSKRVEKNDWVMDSVDYLYLEGVSWELYEHLLKEVGARRLRLTYSQGELEIMSPLPEHENAGRTIGRMVDELTMYLNLPAVGLKSTTFRKKVKQSGLEPDECFYIRSQPKIAGKKRIQLSKDPPPDIAVEVDVTRRSVERMPIYARLGVPEVWRFDGVSLSCYLLDGNSYRQSEYSNAFPKLRLRDLLPFIRLAEQKLDQNAAIKAFQLWLRKQSWAKPKA